MYSDDFGPRFDGFLGFISKSSGIDSVHDAGFILDGLASKNLMSHSISHLNDFPTIFIETCSRKLGLF